MQHIELMKFNKLDKKIFNKDKVRLEDISFYLKELGIMDIPHEFINFENYEQIPGFKKKILNSGDCAKYNTLNNRIEIFKEVIEQNFVNNCFRIWEPGFSCEVL